MGNNLLHTAKKMKNDNFYTSVEDIEREMSYYTDFLKGKNVLCNCDDVGSGFFKYFYNNFNTLELKSLTCTSYAPDHESSNGRATIVTIRDSGSTESKEEKQLLNGNGDFRSEEGIDLLKQADIVVTNPPFSLFREYVSLLMEHHKKFVILGNQNAVKYKEVFPYIRDNKLWLGQTIHSGDRAFYVPESYPMTGRTCGIDSSGRRYVRVTGIRWFTNIDVPARHEVFETNSYYYGNEERYPKLDNFNAIEVSRTKDMPRDYTGVMAVPITFLDKWCPSQFRILGITQSWYKGSLRSKTYKKHKQINPKTGVVKENVMTLNAGPNLEVKEPPKDKTYYVCDGKYYIQKFSRILVKKIVNRN